MCCACQYRRCELGDHNTLPSQTRRIARIQVVVLVRARAQVPARVQKRAVSEGGVGVREAQATKMHLRKKKKKSSKKKVSV